MALTSELTPVQEVNGLLMKRDDLFQPFGRGEVNGGKLRQCIMLVDAALARNPGAQCLFTYCSIHSPQAPITAATARAKGLPCHIVYGGAKAKNIKKLPMPRLAMRYGADIYIGTRSGRHNVLLAKTRELAEEKHGFIVQYGINLNGYDDVLLNAVAAQCENLPEKVENLVITCGSGITAAGMMIGLKTFGKQVRTVHLVATAPDRRAFIHDTLKRHGADREFEYHSLFDRPGFVYEKGARAVWGGITLHPHYEAKTMQWFCQSGLRPADTLFWIVGAEPTVKP